ncbi:MAG: hypothetical protein KGJ11_09540, partial [Candidatus Omnitrophica bacterium]|nr:hypothetical protein [Candidatus Omnitrophota bacterium]
MNSSGVYLERMLSFAKQAGILAVDLIQHSDPGLKKDNTVITLADKAISNLARQTFQDFLSHPGHVLIDEEDSRSKEYLDQKRLEQTPFIWALDPIDG